MNNKFIFDNIKLSTLKVTLETLDIKLDTSLLKNNLKLENIGGVILWI